MQSGENVWQEENLTKVLLDGGIAVMPTDTLYGLVGRAEDVLVVEKLYSIRRRTPEKPCIVLIGAESELQKFSININAEQKKEVEKYWPGPVSIIFDCPDEAFTYLHRGTKTLALRMPQPESLRKLLLATGPLVAPSANPEGMPPAGNIAEAKEYFKDTIDWYADAGPLEGKASKIIRLHQDGSMSIIRA